MTKWRRTFADLDQPVRFADKAKQLAIVWEHARRPLQVLAYEVVIDGIKSPLVDGMHYTGKALSYEVHYNGTRVQRVLTLQIGWEAYEIAIAFAQGYAKCLFDNGFPEDLGEAVEPAPGTVFTLNGGEGEGRGFRKDSFCLHRRVKDKFSTIGAIHDGTPGAPGHCSVEAAITRLFKDTK